jgi:hypothetical protein
MKLWLAVGSGERSSSVNASGGPESTSNALLRPTTPWASVTVSWTRLTLTGRITLKKIGP